MSSILRLGYLGFEVRDLDAWEAFGRDLVGLDVTHPGPDLLVMRLDRYARRLIFTRGGRDDLSYAGWEVVDKPALAAMAERLTRAGYSVVLGTAEAARERAVEQFYRFTDAAGNPIEIFCGPAMALQPCRPGLPHGGFVTGLKGLGHFVAGFPDLEQARTLYCDLLGFEVSDYIFQHNPDGSALRAMFLHANSRHHSIALAEAVLPKKIDHFFLQVSNIEDMGRAYDRFLASPYAVRNSIGQHPNDQCVSFYAATPSGFSIEIGWSDFEIDPNAWSIRTFDRTSTWGHQYVG